jgi:hypothetical protein
MLRTTMTVIDPASDHPVTDGPQAGWYHDPRLPDGTRLRWWNGAGWSEHTRPVLAPAPVPAASAPAVAAPRSPYAGRQGTAVAARAMHNGTAWWSFGLGVVALSISSSGAIAVLSGIRALRIRSLGLADAVWPAVLGITFGALGTLLMLVMLFSA